MCTSLFSKDIKGFSMIINFDLTQRNNELLSTNTNMYSMDNVYTFIKPQLIKY